MLNNRRAMLPVLLASSKGFQEFPYIALRLAHCKKFPRYLDFNAHCLISPGDWGEFGTGAQCNLFAVSAWIYLLKIKGILEGISQHGEKLETKGQRSSLNFRST